MKIKLTTVYVDDHNKALRFYTEVLGLARKADFNKGPFRWLTVVSPEEPDGTELQLALNNNPVAKAYQDGLFQQSQLAAMFFTDDVRPTSRSKPAAPSSRCRLPTCPARPSQC
jgi:catechol 2,3-dioxygenase-like lactoylglutathione lyase family enzyme